MVLPASATNFEDPAFVEADIPRPDGGAWSGVVGLQFTADGERAFAWERDGRVWILDEDAPVTAPFLDIADEVLAWRDHGLLGFALDPGFRANGYVYAYYVVDRHHLEHCTEPASGTGPPVCDAAYDPAFSIFETRATVGRIARYRALKPAGDADFRDATTVDYASRKVILGERRDSACPIVTSTHGVGALLFGADGSLFATCGDSAGASSVDAGSRGVTAWREAVNEGILRPEENVGAYRAQLVDSHNGKLLRMDPATGNGLSTNPFYDAAAPRSPASRTWILGLRNPYRIALRPGTGSHDPTDGDPGVIYIGDVGWEAWEDFHVVRAAGENFGWPVFEGIEQQAEYWAASPFNLDAPNPLANPNTGCPEHFRFTDLIQQDTAAAPPSWPNPCDPSQEIDTARTFLHTPPLLDWRHAVAETRFPAYDTDDALVAVGIGEIAPDGTTVAGSPFSGITSTAGTWYTATDFPATWRNTYFHADYGDQWIRNFVMDGADRLVEVRPFATDAGGVVSIATNPVHGGLYYISWASFVRKVSYAPGGNRPPVAAFSAEPAYGPTPLAVALDAGASSDPEGLTLDYDWDFGDGSGSSVGPVVQHVFEAPDTAPLSFEVRLTVTDAGGASDTTTRLVSVNNSPPQAAITSPVDGSYYSTSTDTVVDLRATLSDAEHGNATLSCQWQVIFHHNDHTHLDPPLAGCEQTVSLSPTSCEATATYWYVFNLEVTDPAGLSTHTTSSVYPDCPGAGPNAVDDGIEVAIGGTASIPVLANDSDDGPLNPYSLVVTAAPLHGTATVDGENGEIVYRHTGSEPVTDTFRYRVRDSLGNPSNEATVTVSVASGPVNQRPAMAALPDRQVAVGATLAFAVLASDDDGPPPLTLAASNLPDGATFVDSGNGSGQFSWTPAPGDDTGSPYDVTFTATDGGGLADSETVRITVTVDSGGAPRLDLAVTTPTGSADLTAEGSADWVHWGLDNAGSLNRKGGVTPRVSDFVAIGGAPGRFSAAKRLTYAWSDGTPTPSASTQAGVYQAGIGKGFEIAVPAQASDQALVIYLGGWKATGRIQASLGDGSAPPMETTVSDLDGPFDRRVAIAFQAATPGTLLTVRFTQIAGTGNVTLQAATLQGEAAPPVNQPPVLSSLADRQITVGESLAFAVTAQDADGPPPLLLDAIGLPAGAAFTDLGGGSGQFSWTPVAGDETGSPYDVTFTATDGEVLSDSETVRIVVSAGGGGGDARLDLGVTTPTGGVDLSSEGGADWVHWGLASAASVNRKAGVTAQVSNFIALGNSPSRFSAAKRLAYAWSDGTPTATANTHAGLYVAGDGSGFEITVPADDAAARTLVVYLGGWKATGRVQASLSDGSVAPVETTLSNLAGPFDRRVAIAFQASAPGAVLTLRYTKTGGSGNVTLQAATLQGEAAPPANQPPVLGSLPDRQVTVGSTLGFAVTAQDDDGPPPLTLEAIGLPADASFEDLGGGSGQFDWTPVAGDENGSPYDVTFIASDGDGLSDSETLRITVTAEGGSEPGIDVAVTSPAGTAGLTAEGGTDWVHWGLDDAASLNRKAGVTPQIGDFIAVGKSPSRFSASQRLVYAWNDGTPTPSASTQAGLYVSGNGNGYELTVAASDTGPRTLVVYLGGWKATGRIELTLSDGSVVPVETTVSDLAGPFDRRVEISFRAANPGSLLTLRYTKTFGTGNVTLQAATLSGV